MTARRLADAAGHLWPITGRRCPICRMPADPVLDGEPHPFCLPAREVSAAEFAAAVRALAEGLGAREFRPLDVWRVSGAALPSASSTPAVDPVLAAIAAATSDDALTAAWRQHHATWTDTHTDAAQRRLTAIGA